MPKNRPAKSERGPVLKDLQEGARILPIVLAARQLRREGKSWRAIGDHEKVNSKWQTVRNWVVGVEHVVSDDELTAADLAPGFFNSGRKPAIQATAEDVAALKQEYAGTNRTEHSGSSQEAARKALNKGKLSPELAAHIRDREAKGQPLLTETIRNAITVGAVLVKQHRNPTDADLDYIYAPGSMMWITDPKTGEKSFIRAGDILEMDDATINFPVCVPWPRGGCKCSDRWGVKVGRFQLLLAIDAAARFIPGYSYTMRPKSSYRGSDVTSTLLGIFRQHGIWKRARFERGVFESDIVKDALEQLGVELMTVWSPHQKPFVEGTFNLMWTKLSDMPGQVGRFMGEEEEANKLVESCRRGGPDDPTKYFPMLSQALNAIEQSVHGRNAQRIQSRDYGTWIPQERWEMQKGEGRLRPLDQTREWMLSPHIGSWTVHGAQVGGLVRIMDDLSIQYHFGATNWLHEYSGCKVKVFFDPFTHRDECFANIVLDQDFRGERKGKHLGTAWQINEVARHTRRVFGWGNDPDMGLEHRKKSGAEFRREIRTIVAGGGKGVSITEINHGSGDKSSKLVIDKPGSTPPKPHNPEEALEERLIRRAAAAQPQARRDQEPIDEPASRSVNLVEVEEPDTE